MGSKSRWDEGHLVFYDDPVETATTASRAINKYGVTVITAATQYTYNLGPVEKGLTKYIVALSTFSHVVRGATVVDKILFGTTAGKRYSLTIAPTSKNKTGIMLRGISTNQWAVMSRSSAICSYTTVCT